MALETTPEGRTTSRAKSCATVSIDAGIVASTSLSLTHVVQNVFDPPPHTVDGLVSNRTIAPDALPKPCPNTLTVAVSSSGTACAMQVSVGFVGSQPSG